MRTIVFMAAALSAIWARLPATAQTTWSTTGNTGTSASTNFIGTRDAQDLVFKTQNIERGRLLNTGGTWRFGTSTNFTKIDAAGKLTFGGTGSYLVQPNKYVFQYSGSPNVGLYFNQTAFVHEFRDQNGAVAASVGVNTGNGYFKGKLGIGTPTPSAALHVITDGSLTNGLRLSATTSATEGASLYLDGATKDWNIVATNASSGAGANKLVFYDNSLASERMVIDATGNIGIGTTAPANKLDVTGSGHFSGTLQVGNYILPSADGAAGQVLTSNGAGTIAWTTVSSGVGINPWTFNGSNIYYTGGNAGVGTTTPAYKLDVIGTGRFAGSLQIGNYILPATDGTVGQVLTTNGAGTASWATVSSTGETLWTASGNNIYNNASGNTGIGTITPAYKLDVTGTGHFTGALKVGAYTLPATDGTAGQVLASNGAGTLTWTTVSSGGTNPWNANGSNLYYSVGNIGIGTTSPVYKLDVSGGGRITGNLQAGTLQVGNYTFPATDGTPGQVLTTNGAGSASWTTVSSGGSAGPWTASGSNIYFTGGNTGLGTVTPAFKLDVMGTGRFAGSLQIGNYNLPAIDGTPGQVLTTNGAGTASWSTATNPWAANGSNLYYNVGNIGIGTTSPAYKFDVAGTGRFTGALKVGAYTLPATDGTSGQVLTSNGAGTVAWTTVSGSGGTNPWTTSGSNIYYTGNASIGTSALATGYKLSVGGKIMCEEVKVQLASAWPDYVFHKDYSLLPINELAAQVEKNKHLPGIPSAKEIEKDGIQLGDMQGKMMEKIEELTLYMIDANKEISTANKSIKTLQEQNTLLQQRINKLESGN